MVTLPNSGFRLQIPMILRKKAVKSPKEKGRGTIPDHVIEPSIEAISAGKDLEMEFVLKLIEKE